MAPTFSDGEWITASRNIGTIRRGDVLVIQTEAGTMLKRVEMVPGDTFSRLYRFTGTVDLVRYGKSKKSNLRIRQVTLMENEYYMIGDNYMSSIDSRQFGPILREHILGKVTRETAAPAAE